MFVGIQIVFWMLQLSQLGEYTHGKENKVKILLKTEEIMGTSFFSFYIFYISAACGELLRKRFTLRTGMLFVKASVRTAEPS